MLSTCLGAGERSTNRWVVTIQLHYIIFHYFGDSTKLYMFPTILSRVFVNECDIMMLYFKKSIWCFFCCLMFSSTYSNVLGNLFFFSSYLWILWTVQCGKTLEKMQHYTNKLETEKSKFFSSFQNFLGLRTNQGKHHNMCKCMKAKT